MTISYLHSYAWGLGRLLPILVLLLCILFGSAEGQASFFNKGHARKLSSFTVSTMTELYNKVSRNGNARMANGDTTILAETTYRCSDGSCDDNVEMLNPLGLYGGIECASDDTECIIDGEDTRRCFDVESGTGGQTLTFRALTFNGNAQGNSGGGIAVRSNGIVNVILCIFTSCASSNRGGAIDVESSANVNVYGSSFVGNSGSGNGDDIYNRGTATIHNTCPTPYSSNTPTQGSALDIDGTVSGSVFSYTDCVDPCVATSTPSDDGSGDKIFCINGGTAVRVSGSCTCQCPTGYGGTECNTCASGYSGASCSADPCVATSISTDDGSDGNF